MPDPDVAVPQVEHDRAVTGTAHVLGRQVQVMALDEGQGGADIQAGHVLRRHQALALGEHLAAAEQLDVVIPCLCAVDVGVAQQQFQGLIGIPAVQRLIVAQAPRQHEVAHAADQPLRVPERDRHAGTEQGAQARWPRCKAHLAGRQYHFGRTDRLFHGLR
jgi:hypothetical protein